MTNNQCDGCIRGVPLENGIHREEYPGGSFGCTAYIYDEKAERTALGIEVMEEKIKEDIKKKYTAKEKFLYGLGITEAGMYQLAILAYEEYNKEKPPLTFVEWCTHKFDGIEDEFLK